MNLRVNEKFKPIFEDVLDNEFYILHGGRASGKTFAKNLALIKTLAEKRDISIAEFSGMHHPYDYEAAINHLGLNREDFIFTPTFIKNKKSNSKIHLLSLNVVSNYINLGWLDIISADECDDLVYEAILDSNTPKTAKIFIFNEIPNYVTLNENDKNCQFIYTNYKDNVENLNPHLIERFELIKEEQPLYYNNVIICKKNYGKAS